MDIRVTPDGIPYSLSSTQMMIDSKGDNTDSGIEPHVVLVGTDADGQKDYSGLFDLEKISAAFAEFYGTDESSSPEKSCQDDSQDDESSAPDEREESSSREDASPATGIALPAAAALCVLILAVLVLIKRRS